MSLEQFFETRYVVGNLVRKGTDPLVVLTKAVACAINQGVLDDTGVARPRPARIFVDNSLLLAISRWIMLMALAALIEEIFDVMGEPDTAI